MALQHMVDEELQEIADLARALFATDAAGLATASTQDSGTHTYCLNTCSLNPDRNAPTVQPLPIAGSPFEAALQADPRVVALGPDHDALTDGPLTSFVGVVVPDPLGGIEGVLWAGSLDDDWLVADSRADIMEVLGRQLRRRLDTAEEQRQLRDASLSVSESAGALASNLLRVEASNRDLEAFAYVASHELARPLSAIRSLSEVLGDSLDAETPLDRDALRRALSQIEENARQLQQQIAALLSMSRLDANADDVTEVDVNLTVSDVIDQLTPLINSTEAQVEVGPMPIVRGESASFTAIIRNFLSNALVYRSPDRDPHITISATSVEGQVTISVTDNGLGIDPADVSRLFQMFQRGESGQPGTGIGLALCRRLAERMHGDVGAEPVEPHGSRFWLSLPADGS